jgi:hypothetical protein
MRSPAEIRLRAVSEYIGVRIPSPPAKPRFEINQSIETCVLGGGRKLIGLRCSQGRFSKICSDKMLHSSAQTSNKQ